MRRPDMEVACFESSRRAGWRGRRGGTAVHVCAPHPAVAPSRARDPLDNRYNTDVHAAPACAISPPTSDGESQLERPPLARSLAAPQQTHHVTHTHARTCRTRKSLTYRIDQRHRRSGTLRGAGQRQRRPSAERPAKRERGDFSPSSSSTKQPRTRSRPASDPSADDTRAFCRFVVGGAARVRLFLLDRLDDQVHRRHLILGHLAICAAAAWDAAA